MVRYYTQPLQLRDKMTGHVIQPKIDSSSSLIFSCACLFIFLLYYQPRTRKSNKLIPFRYRDETSRYFVFTRRFANQCRDHPRGTREINKRVSR
jgi:hypothetical protein